MNGLDLYDVIEGCKKNDRKSQEVLYYHFYDKMMCICRSYFKQKHLAEEVLNNGWLRAFKNIVQYEHLGSFEGWLRKIINHACYDATNNKTRNSELTDSFISVDNQLVKNRDGESYIYYNHPEHSKDLIPDAIHHRNIIEAMYNVLPSNTKNIFKMRMLGYKHLEIAKAFNIVESTSKWHCHHAREIINEKLGHLI